MNELPEFGNGLQLENILKKNWHDIYIDKLLKWSVSVIQGGGVLYNFYFKMIKRCKIKTISHFLVNVIKTS